MIDNYILVGAQHQARLEAAKAAFFNSGGRVIELVPFQYKPPPLRKHPAPGRKISNHAQHGQRQARAIERATQVSEMAKTMTCREISQALDIPQSTLWTMSEREDFQFAKGAKGKRLDTCPDESTDARLAERITALRDAGLSRWQVERKVGIGNKTLVRITEAFNIDFPKRRGRSGGSAS